MPLSLFVSPSVPLLVSCYRLLSPHTYTRSSSTPSSTVSIPTTLERRRRNDPPPPYHRLLDSVVAALLLHTWFQNLQIHPMHLNSSPTLQSLQLFVSGEDHCHRKYEGFQQCQCHPLQEHLQLYLNVHPSSSKWAMYYARESTCGSESWHHEC